MEIRLVHFGEIRHNSSDAIKNDQVKWIRVSVIESQYSISICVTDSGKGLSRELGAKIMQPFFTTKEKGAGSGLGLSISKSILKANFGLLEINYQSPNTQFMIKLPKKDFFCLYDQEFTSANENLEFQMH